MITAENIANPLELIRNTVEGDSPDLVMQLCVSGYAHLCL